GSQLVVSDVTSPSTYYVSLIIAAPNGSGQCDESSRKSISVEASPLPESPVAIDPVARRCGTGTVTLEVWGPYAGYQWYDEEDNPFSGATSATLVAQINQLDEDLIYKVKSISADGCESDFTEVVARAVGDCESYIFNRTVRVRGISSENQLDPLGIGE